MWAVSCSYHEGVPVHGGAQAVEGVGGPELGDDPVVAVPLDDGLVEVEQHHHGDGGGSGHLREETADGASCLRRFAIRDSGVASGCLVVCWWRRLGLSVCFYSGIFDFLRLVTSHFDD